MQADVHGAQASLSAPSGLVGQLSRKIRDGSRRLSSGSRTLSFDQLERGASQYYRNNSLSFGQVVAVDDDELELQLHLDGLNRRSGTHPAPDLEAGNQECASVFEYKSINWRPFPTKKGGTPHPTLPKDTRGPVIEATHRSQPGQNGSRLETIILEQSWFTVYKRLFVASFVLNVVGLVLAITENFPYAKSNAAMFSVANVLVAVLVRNELFLRFLFWLAVQVLGHRFVPVRIKTLATAFLQSVGGIHSGCGTAAIAWLVYALEKSLEHRAQYNDGIRGVAVGILFLLLLSCAAAFPVLRHIHHNFFERIHRFAGWSSLGLVWAYVALSTLWDPGSQSYRVSGERRAELARAPTLWLTLATTIMVVLPWLTVRKVTVETVAPRTRLNSLLHFHGGLKPGLLARISPSPFSEWHAFGTISDGQKRHTVLAGAVGDFTKSLVNSPPTHIWVRTCHFAGLPYLTNMYQKAILVATGSGIGVFLSFLMQPTRAEVHIIWIAKNIKDSYGEGIWEVVRETSSENFTVVDTAVYGRPRTKDLVVGKAKEWGAEVVIVTSNPRGTNEIVNGCKAAGIPAFGPIWDS